MGILLFTATPVEIISQILEYFRRSVGLSTVTSCDVCLKYQHNVLRQMNMGIVKSLITKSVKLIIRQHNYVRVVMSRDYSNDPGKIDGADKFRKIYCLAVSHYPDLIRKLEADTISKFYNDPRYDFPEHPAGGFPCDVGSRYYLFLLAR